MKRLCKRKSRGQAPDPQSIWHAGGTPSTAGNYFSWGFPPSLEVVLPTLNRDSGSTSSVPLASDLFDSSHLSIGLDVLATLSRPVLRRGLSPAEASTSLTGVPTHDPHGVALLTTGAHGGLPSHGRFPCLFMRGDASTCVGGKKGDRGSLRGCCVRAPTWVALPRLMIHQRTGWLTGHLHLASDPANARSNRNHIWMLWYERIVVSVMDFFSR